MKKAFLVSAVLAVLLVAQQPASAASFDVIASGGEVLGTLSYQENVGGKFLEVSFSDNPDEAVNATSLTFTYLNNKDKSPSSWTIDLSAPTFSTFAPVKVGGNNAKFVALTSVAVTSPVPEPETYALMLAGLGVVGWAARRRKSAAVAPSQALPA